MPVEKLLCRGCGRETRAGWYPWCADCFAPGLSGAQRAQWAAFNRDEEGRSLVGENRARKWIIVAAVAFLIVVFVAGLVMPWA